MFIADTANDLLLRQFAQTIKRKDGVDILVGISMIIVFMCDHELAGWYVTWYQPPAIIAIYMKWFLVAQMHTRRRHEREDRLIQFADPWGIGDTPFRHGHRLCSFFLTSLKRDKRLLVVHYTSENISWREMPSLIASMCQDVMGYVP